MSAEGGAEFTESPDLLVSRDPGDDVTGKTANECRLSGIEAEPVDQGPHDGGKGVAIIVCEGCEAMATAEMLGEVLKPHRFKTTALPQFARHLMTI